jgi:dTDP-4-dehydrorhamnose reductase
MRIVVTGRQGQVARSLVERATGTKLDVVLLGRPQLDLESDTGAIVRAIVSASPDLIVSAAAYTAVDKAESEPALAFRVNSVAPGAIASAAADLGVPLIHLSTDYVFAGSKDVPYVESDPTGPTGVYGASKLAGEEAVLHTHANSAILRTAWVYSPFGANFVKTMLRLAADRHEVAVVADQRGSPTSALDIADGLLTIAENLVSAHDPKLRGIFHMTGGGEASWAKFAEHIFAASAQVGGPSAQVRQIATADYPTPAKRPTNSRLDCSKLAHIHGVRLPDWTGSTTQIVQRLVGATPELSEEGKK